MSAFWKLAQVIWIFESWLGLFKAWTSFIKPATESSRELSVTGWGLTMEPLGASDLNEELEDDLQVSTDIIVATVCDFSPVKVWNKVWRIYFFWSSKQIAQLCMNNIFTYLATSIFPSKLSKFHRDELEQLRFDQLSNRIGNKLEIMTDFFSWFTQTTFFRISADQKFLAKVICFTAMQTDSASVRKCYAMFDNCLSSQIPYINATYTLTKNPVIQNLYKRGGLAETSSNSQKN